jgi:hypothetical protein
MKFLCFLLITFFALPAMAAPFLVSDPVDPATCGGDGQNNCPVFASCYEDGQEFVTNHPLETDMSIRVDLAGRPSGIHEYTCIYFDEFGGLSLQSNPTRLGSAPPQNLRLTP